MSIPDGVVIDLGIVVSELSNGVVIDLALVMSELSVVLDASDPDVFPVTVEGTDILDASLVVVKGIRVVDGKVSMLVEGDSVIVDGAAEVGEGDIVLVAGATVLVTGGTVAVTGDSVMVEDDFVLVEEAVVVKGVEGG